VIVKLKGNSNGMSFKEDTYLYSDAMRCVAICEQEKEK